MAINSDFNYDDILSLDKAKLIDRAFLNSLGSQELILDYNGIASAAREDSVEWLHANRKSIEDPEFGFKTYEGTWFCIDIKYDENNKTIRQRFKIDSSLLDDVTKRTSAGTLAEKSYYWKIVNPDFIELPVAVSIPDGTTYTKTSNDNGDGTYDVVVSKDVSVDFGGGGSSCVSGEQGVTGASASTSIFVSGSDDSAADQEYEYTSGVIGEIDALWTGVDTPAWTIEYYGVGTVNQNGWYIWQGSISSSDAYRPNVNLNSSEWFDYSEDSDLPLGDFRFERVVQIGANPPAVVEVVSVSTNSDELSFVKDGGTVANPTSGQEKTISNSSLGNGKFSTTITTRTVNQQRVPALIDSIVYASEGILDKNAIIVAKNATYEQFQIDINGLNATNKSDKNNSVSVSINRFGLYDYTIRSIETGA
jgi:hypothetical protein